jgi:hypothetical protein
MLHQEDFEKNKITLKIKNNNILFCVIFIDLYQKILLIMLHHDFALCGDDML